MMINLENSFSGLIGSEAPFTWVVEIISHGKKGRDSNHYSRVGGKTPVLPLRITFLSLADFIF